MKAYVSVALLVFLALNLCWVNVIAKPSTRVVGGVDATDGEFPHQVSLRRETGSHTCGGSILSHYYVLTAAHCVTQETENGQVVARDPKFYSIRAGSTNRLTGGIVVNIKRIIVHEKFLVPDNDVALLLLSEPLIFSKNIQPIGLPVQDVEPGDDVIISGWGRIKTDGDIPLHLQWNTLTDKLSSECGFPDRILCLAHSKDNGACNGDSGGPAVYKSRLAGVAGFVLVACGTRFPDGYANVYHHRTWIKNNSDV